MEIYTTSLQKECISTESRYSFITFSDFKNAAFNYTLEVLISS